MLNPHFHKTRMHSVVMAEVLGITGEGGAREQREDIRPGTTAPADLGELEAAGPKADSVRN